MNKLHHFLTAGLWALLLAACGTKDDPVPLPEDTIPHFADKPGVFILNEGLFQWGNGSIDFWSPISGKIYHDIFRNINQRPTGDVVQYMAIWGKKAWIVVNNSGKIEVVDLATFQSLKTFTGFTSPRYILRLNKNKIYVSDLYQPVVYVLDTSGNPLKTITLTRTSEQLIEAGEKVWALNWSSYGGFDNTGVTIINPLNDSAEAFIRLGKEPNSAVQDKNGDIWVLCSGGFMHEEKPTLWRLSSTGEAKQTFYFEAPGDYPTRLSINPAGDSLYYLNRDVFALPIENPAIPGTKWIAAEERNFYGLSVGKNILLSDPLNYQTRGKVYVYSRNGTQLYTLSAGIVPGNFCRNE
ncbi:MAG: YncE family protein [Bacteroidales bacterium]